MAAHIPLDKNATLRSVVPSLGNKVKFVTKACETMDDHSRRHGPVVLHLGVSAGSKGRRPNYLLRCAGTGVDVATIDGDTHKPWIGTVAARGGAWSDVAMTLGEVRELLGELVVQERLKG